MIFNQCLSFPVNPEEGGVHSTLRTIFLWKESKALISHMQDGVLPFDFFLPTNFHTWGKSGINKAYESPVDLTHPRVPHECDPDWALLPKCCSCQTFCLKNPKKQRSQWSFSLSFRQKAPYLKLLIAASNTDMLKDGLGSSEAGIVILRIYICS